MNTHLIIRKLKRNLFDYGLLATIKKSLFYVLKPFFYYTVYRVYCIELSMIAPREITETGFSYTIISPEDFKIIQQVEDMEEWLQGQLSKKLKQGGLCLVALDNYQVAAFNLIGFKNVFLPLIEKNIVLNPDEAWSEQITVHKQYRQRGVASALRYLIFSELKKRGIKKFFGAALKKNTPSLQLARKVGFREVEDISFMKFCGYRRWRSRLVVVE
jgi:GNAT superfamily N-acetyltransferase